MVGDSVFSIHLVFHTPIYLFNCGTDTIPEDVCTVSLLAPTYPPRIKLFVGTSSPVHITETQFALKLLYAGSHFTATGLWPVCHYV